jgi:hypothetical protein
LRLLHTQADHRIGDRLLGQRRRRSPDQRGRLEREHRRQVLALQPLDEDVKGLARVLTAAVLAAGQGGAAVHEDAAGAERGRFFEQQAVGLLQFLAEDLTRREDDAELAFALERRQVPAEAPRIPHQFVGRDFEDDDDARLAELARAAVDELDAERGLAGADGALGEDDVAARDAVAKDGVEPEDAGADRFGTIHGGLRSLALARGVQPASAIWSPGARPNRPLARSFVISVIACRNASRPSRVETASTSEGNHPPDVPLTAKTYRRAACAGLWLRVSSFALNRFSSESPIRLRSYPRYAAI